MDSDTSASALLSLACRFLPHDQWFTTHVDPDWKVKQVKSWLLAKCLPYAAPPSPPLRQKRRPQRPPSPITFAPDPRHRPISPITFAMPKAPPVQDSDDADGDDEEPPADDELSEPDVRPPPQRKRVAPSAVSTSTKGDLVAGYTLLRFSTGQLLEDDLPLSFYDLHPDELLELHRRGVVVSLPRADPVRYLDAYWEGWVRVLRMRPIDDEEDTYALYKIRPLETRALEWRDRWLVVREGSVYFYRDQVSLIHTLALADLAALAGSECLPPTPAPPARTRVLGARFHNPPHAPNTRASSHGHSTRDTDSSSILSSPIFAHASSGSDRPRRPKPTRRKRKRHTPEPTFLALDFKDDHGLSYANILRMTADSTQHTPPSCASSTGTHYHPPPSSTHCRLAAAAAHSHPRARTARTCRHRCATHRRSPTCAHHGAGRSAHCHSPSGARRCWVVRDVRGWGA
ncbi:hypothetical protein B0H10DRAFT_2021032 [Mycena sp. CBHHK59/15]|nr:hypothetical protein B0H10DRAFT_2021032 [Mycena sp. CBHHK59/15]